MHQISRHVSATWTVLGVATALKPERCVNEIFDRYLLPSSVHRVLLPDERCCVALGPRSTARKPALLGSRQMSNRRGGADRDERRPDARHALSALQSLADGIAGLVK